MTAARDALGRLASACGASARIGRPEDYGKRKLVTLLSQHFERTADPEAAAVAVELVDFSPNLAPRNSLTKPVGAVMGSGVEGRGGANKAALARAG